MKKGTLTLLALAAGVYLLFRKGGALSGLAGDPADDLNKLIQFAMFQNQIAVADQFRAAANVAKLQYQRGNIGSTELNQRLAALASALQAKKDNGQLKFITLKEDPWNG